MMDTLLKKITFQIRTNEVDANGHLTLPSLVNYFQEAASLHVIDLKVTAEDLLQHNLMWVLNHLRIEIFTDLPTRHSTVHLETFPSGFDKFFFYRDFFLHNHTGNLLANATSTWLVVDVLKRRLAPVPDFLKAIKINHQRSSIPVAKAKIPLFDSPSFQFRTKVGWYDLDTNNHTNNTHYFRWLVEGLPPAVFMEKKLKSVEVIFKSESSFNDSLTVQTLDNQDDSYFHQIINQDGKLLLQAQSNWHGR